MSDDTTMNPMGGDQTGTPMPETPAAPAPEAPQQ